MLTILVTGAAGLIGGEVCARAARAGHKVIALVRHNGVVRGNDRAVVAIVPPLRGDVRAEFCGLDPASLGQVDVVVHCAASLAFDAPETQLHETNVNGTSHAAGLARALGARFLHVSTAYVCGLAEGAIPEAPIPPGTRFANGYEESKALAEEVVRTSGVPFAIARPSITLGESGSGRIREFPSLCNVFRLMARGKVRQFPATSGSTLDLVPIDHVAEGILRMAVAMERVAGQHLHLVSGNPLAAAELAHGVARVRHFPDPRVVDPDSFDPSSLPGTEARVTQAMLATFGSYFSRNPRFADGLALSLTGLSRPAADRAWLDRLISFAIDAGYLPAAPVTEHRDSAVPAAPAHQVPTAHRP